MAWLTDRLDITTAVYHGRTSTTQQQQQFLFLSEKNLLWLNEGRLLLYMYILVGFFYSRILSEGVLLAFAVKVPAMLCSDPERGEHPFS